MSVHWDRPWDSQGDEEREWSRELEERFEAGEQPATEGGSSTAAGDAEELAAEAPESDASEFDFSAGVELSCRPLGWNGKPKGRALIKPDEVRLAFSPHERLLILDTWQRSGLPAGDFAPLVGLSKHTLYLWKKRFAEHGPAGLAEQPRGAKTRSKLSEVTRRTIVMLKEAHPEWGCQRISDELARGPALAASVGRQIIVQPKNESRQRLDEP